MINFLSSSSQELGLSKIDELLLLFGHASALIQIGRPEVSFKQKWSNFILFFFIFWQKHHSAPGTTAKSAYILVVKRSSVIYIFFKKQLRQEIFSVAKWNKVNFVAFTLYVVVVRM